jgi:hypothetical protein
MGLLLVRRVVVRGDNDLIDLLVGAIDEAASTSASTLRSSTVRIAAVLTTTSSSLVSTVAVFIVVSGVLDVLTTTTTSSTAATSAATSATTLITTTISTIESLVLFSSLDSEGLVLLDSDGEQLDEAASDVLLVLLVEGHSGILTGLEGNDSLTGGLTIRVLSNLNRVLDHSESVEEVINIIFSH